MIRRVKSGSAAHALAQESDNPVAVGDVMNASCPALRNAFLLRFVDFPRHWLELAQFSLAFGRVVCQIVEKENRLIGWPTNVKMPTIRPSCTNKSVVIFEIKFDNFNALLGC